MGKEAIARTAPGIPRRSHAAAEVAVSESGAAAARPATGTKRPPRPGHVPPAAAAAATGARQAGRRGTAASDEQHRRAATTPAKVGAEEASAPGGEEEAHRTVRALRRAVHDGAAPEGSREGAEAPEQGGLPRRGDERAVPGVQRPPLQRPQRPAAPRREAAPPAAQAQRGSLMCVATLLPWLDTLFYGLNSEVSAALLSDTRTLNRVVVLLSCLYILCVI